MALDLNRRAFMAGASVAAVGAGVALPAVAVAGGTGFSDAVTKFRTACENSARFHERVYKPAYESLQHGMAALPHYETATTFEMGNGRTRPLSTANATDVRVAQSVAKDCRPSSDPFNLACRELTAAQESRDQQKEEMSRHYRVTEYARRSDELGGVSATALWDVEMFPATNIRDLILKLEILEGEDIEEAQVETMLADLRRIAGRQA